MVQMITSMQTNHKKGEKKSFFFYSFDENLAAGFHFLSRDADK